ncbi:hypothetical protein KFK09_019474 [Dendrobium nobile]|uniref:Transposon Ty3-I Gag-Pol polyprotein n=1 Tax=Dendrobium nobile TaxID=94219 RepID=A0A8T3AWT9_DENNO|nr:hypothetical protein KFK09_019474 [Dendrobium nobile]
MEFMVTESCRVSFSIGKHYKCKVLCDVCHLILGRPWQFDVGVHYDGRANVYSLDWKGRRLRLLPSAAGTSSPSKEPAKHAAIHLVAGTKLVQEWREHAPMFALVITEPNQDSELLDLPSDVAEFLDQYRDIIPKELPAELPPLRKIQHQIDFIPGATLPNLPHYRLNPKEQVILQELIDDLLRKQLIQASLSPCAVPALLVPKKYSTWRMCIDSRAVNKISIKYRFPMPRIDELLDQLTGSAVFSKLDLRSVYH